MRGWPRLRALAVVPILALIGLSAVGITEAQAAPGQCAAGGGVTVVVDFAGLGDRGIAHGCATDPGNGLSALRSATASVRTTSAGFVCQIDTQPTDQTCVRTPPASAYWSYWYALAGQSTWTYSGLGATFRTPPAGSVDGWRFGGSSDKPAISPAQARGDHPPEASSSAPPPASESTPPLPGAADPSASIAPTSTAAPSVSASGPATGSAVPSDGPTTAAGEVLPSASASPSTADSRAPSPSASATGPHVVEVQPASARASTGGGGSLLPTLLGVALVATLAAAGGFVAWRRSQQVE